jgi:1-acyl-sn-glycerol-3-phosphate acyltransferase
MAEIKPQVYKDPRPESYFTRFHEWARTHDVGWTYEFVRMLLTPVAMLLYRTRGIQTTNVPSSGPAIIAPNHFSNMDHFFAGVYLRRKMRFMAKSQLFSNPILEYIFRVGGVFPVRRGYRDEETFITAHSILDRGQCVLMYCEGGRSRTGKLSERPKRGIGRLALESGAVIVPVAIHGSSKVRNWKKLQFPKVTVQYGEPFRYEQLADPSREQQQAAAEEIFAAIKEVYAGLDELGRAGARAKARVAGTTTA